ncbi:murein biosynthesis integral membrane protein MurJ [Xanthobacter sp. TB0136]|uniref:murein biosynthesis integral membrane protein MurJ n=1 Tax=Xanthobacter sp. TB0136 TaxID=3459177 RepID=UPI00403966FE
MSLRARTSIVSVATLGSRILGFMRDAAIAAVLGVGPVADALAAALALPLLARRLLAEGAFNLAFIPALVDEKEQGRASPLVLATGALLVGALLLAACVAAFFMPALIGLLAPGFESAGARAELAVLCGRIAVFYLPLAGLAAIYGGIANAEHRVLLPALAPVAANLTVLAVLLVLAWQGMLASDRAALVIAAATVAAGISQLVLMRRAARGCVAFRAEEGKPRPPMALHWRKAARVLRQAIPALLFAGLSQFRFMIALALVSATDGAMAALNYAQRLMDLPLGLVGASAGAVLLPLLVRKGRGQGDDAGRALLAALAFAWPAAIGLHVLAEPVVQLLFKRGSFDAEGVRQTAAILGILALSLPFQGLERVLSAIASAGGVMRMGERIAIASLLVCLLAGLGLGAFGGVLSVVAAVALSAFASVVALCVLLVRGGHLALGAVLMPLLGVCMAGLLMGGAVTLLERATRHWPIADGWLMEAARLLFLVGGGVAIYGLLLLGLVALRRYWPMARRP